ncbi:MAG: hypothetical protein J2P50_14940 [Hyphomicrobiaceae bacterium]|nr:hypothetical protein [Hyphomicrobiaceae bacterium]
MGSIEGSGERGSVRLLRAEFHTRNAAQIGFCSPAMLPTAAAPVEETARLSREAAAVLATRGSSMWQKSAAAHMEGHNHDGI